LRNRRSRLLGLSVLALMLAGAAPRAQQPAAPPTQASQPLPAPAPAVDYPKISLTAGRSTVLTTDFDITRLAITNPAVADAVVVQPREVLIDGKAAGTVSLILWGGGSRTQYDIVVDSGVLVLEQQLKALFPGEDIRVVVNEEALILSGSVSSNAIMLRAAEIAAASSGKLKVINMLQLPGGSESQQVMLQVRFAEVNRSALKELGLNLVANRVDWAGRITTGQFPAPVIDDNVTTFSDFLNIFFFSKREGIGGVLQALRSRGHFQSLAEPNLIAYNGQEASFLAGGEFPVPFVSGAAGTVSVVFKEFGIRLNFKPTIAGDVIRLHVRPEVSTLDFNNGVTISGFRIPALTTRRAETDVELRDGQSFAIAGLLNNVSQTNAQEIPILSALPIIGSLFKSKAERAERTELMVLITPRLVRALDPDEVPPLPTTPGDFLPTPEPENTPATPPASQVAPSDAPPVASVLPRKDQRK
jgi:pilus assembly protein CpaC